MVFTFPFITTLLVHTFIALDIFGLLCKYFHLIYFFLINRKAFLLSIELKSCHFWAKRDLRVFHPTPPGYIWEDRPREGKVSSLYLTGDGRVNAQPVVSSTLCPLRRACHLSDLLSIQLKDNSNACWKPLKGFLLNLHITHWHVGAHFVMQRLWPIWRHVGLELGPWKPSPVPTVSLFIAGFGAHPRNVGRGSPRGRGMEEAQGSSYLLTGVGYLSF